MSFEQVAVILGAAVCTFLPRFVPFLLQDLHLPPAVEKYLGLMPVAALGALIVPGVFLAFPGKPGAGLVGIAAAGLWSFFRGGLVIPVVLALGVTWVSLLLMN